MGVEKATSASPAPFSRDAADETGRTFGDPFDEFGETGMPTQSLGRGEIARQFALGQGGMDFLVADVMQKDGRTPLATFEFGHQMVCALRHIWRDRTPAKGTYGPIILHRSCSIARIAARQVRNRGTPDG